MRKKSRGLGSLITGIALGAAAVFFSKKENRDKAQVEARKAAKKAKVVARKARTQAKTAVKKAKAKSKKIETKVNREVKKIKKIAKSKR